MKYNFESEFLEKHEDKTDNTNRREKLSEIGSGAFRECQFNIQKDLYDLADLGLSEHYELKDGIKFFGDNFSGDFSGFDFNKNNELVVVFWHEDGTVYETNKTFKEYIREQMLIGENGQDERE